MYYMAASTARGIAAQEWGEVHVQRKLAEGIWVFSTARHGGIITDTTLRPESKFNEVEPGFATFEEDAEADMVEWLYMKDIHTEHFKFITCGDDKSFPDWQQDRINQLRERLQHWFPEFLAKHPFPGIAAPAPLLIDANKYPCTDCAETCCSKDCYRIHEWLTTPEQLH